MDREQIKKINAGIEKYQYLRNRLFTTDVSVDRDFQRMFNGFFKMRQRTKAYYDDYFCYLEQHKEQGVSFADAFQFLYDKHGKMEVSFASKMVALVNPDNPIWDSVVAGKHFGMKMPYTYAKNRFEKVVEKYDEYCRGYATYMQSKEAKEKIELFNHYFPNTDISDVKKVDFIFWQQR